MLPRLHPTRNAPTTVTTTRASLTTVRQDRAHVVIRAVGEWDLANAHILAEQLDEHEKAGRRFVRLDVSDVTFLDSTCLSVLLTTHQRLLAARGTFVLTGVTPRLTRLLQLTHLDRELLTTSVADLDTRPDYGAHRSRRGSARPVVRPA